MLKAIVQSKCAKQMLKSESKAAAPTARLPCFLPAGKSCAVLTKALACDYLFLVNQNTNLGLASSVMVMSAYL